MALDIKVLDENGEEIILRESVDDEFEDAKNVDPQEKFEEGETPNTFNFDPESDEEFEEDIFDDDDFFGDKDMPDDAFFANDLDDIEELPLEVLDEGFEDDEDSFDDNF